jgi:hypothetical protein
MPLDVDEAIRRVLLGESIASLRGGWRAQALAAAGMRGQDAPPQAFAREAGEFARRLCRTLGERHAGDRRAAIALKEFVVQCDDYDAFDALLASFPQFEGRARIVARGRQLFPGPLTAHW